MINSVNKSLSFASRIELINCNIYSQIIERLYKYPETEIINMNEVSGICKNGDTSAMSTCTGGGVKNNDNIVLFHLSRDIHVEGNKADIEQKVKHLQENGALSGLIAGGEFYDISLDCLNAFKSVLKNFKINMSVLWGHEPYGHSGTNVSYVREDDAWYVNTTKNFWGRDSHIKTLAEFKKFYKYIYISEADTLVLDGKNVSREKVNSIDKPF